MSHEGLLLTNGGSDSTAAGNANCSRQEAADEAPSANLAAVFQSWQSDERFAPLRNDTLAIENVAESDPGPQGTLTRVRLCGEVPQRFYSLAPLKFAGIKRLGTWSS
jgi:hypothetical protein